MTGRLTQAGMIMGSLAYMAPEQLAGEEEDPRTDVYALGVTLFELATDSGRLRRTGRRR